MAFLEQGTGTEQLPDTDEDVRDSLSLPSSDGSDVTIRQNSKFHMPNSENNNDKEASLEEQLSASRTVEAVLCRRLQLRRTR